MTVPRLHSSGRLSLAIASAALIGLTSTILSAVVVAADPVTRKAKLLADEALIMGGTGPCCVTPETPWGVPGPPYTTAADQLFIAPNLPGYTPIGLATPEQLAPLTGLDSETFGTSLRQGTDALDTAIKDQIANGNNVVAFGYSQSATIETLELERLAALPADERPSTDQLAFVMIGDGNNPDGGLLERFVGAYIPSLDATFSGATPGDVYPTDIYMAQYDGWADFPQYPLNILADLNAFAGIAYVHGSYPYLTPAQIASARELPTVGDTMTHYYLIPTENLPLLEPLKQLGAPQWLIDLIQPGLRVLIELGYDRTAAANMPTPAELFPTDVNPITVVDDLVIGTVQGINNALTDVGLPELPAQITGPITALETSLGNLANQTEPTIQAISAGLQDALNSATVSAQLAGALGPVSAAVGSLDTALSQLINTEIDPAVQAAVYAVGDPLRALTAAEQLLPIVLETPGNVVTNAVHYVANGLQDLVTNDFAGFIEQLELIPTADITWSLFTDVLSVLGLEDMLAGGSLSL